MRRRVRPRLVAAMVAGLAGVVLVLGLAAPASAHATLLTTNPTEGQVLGASPGRALLTFDETVKLPDKGVQVFDADGNAVATTATTRDAVLDVDLPDTLARGTYVVSWRVISSDGHPVAGALTFSVGRPSLVVKHPVESGPTSDPMVRGALGVAQGVGYLSLFLAAGLVLFCAWLLPDLPRLAELRARLRRVARVAAGVCVAAELVQLPLDAAYQQGGSLGGVLQGGGWGDVGGRELLSFGLLTLGLLTAVLVLPDNAPTGRRRTTVLAAAAVSIAAPAVVGHSRAFAPQALIVAVDVLHVAAGSVWFGGLVGLAISLPALAGRARAAADLIARFSGAATGVLATLVASGVLLGWRIVGSWTDLVGSGYGRTLMVKVGLVAVAAAIAGVNRYLLLDRVTDSAGHAARVRATALIRRAVVGEATVLVVVLLLTGFLVNLSPRQAPPTLPQNPTGVAVAPLGDDLRVLGTLSPGTRGTNSVTLQLQSATGEPFEPVRPPTVRVSSDSVSLGDVALTPIDAGTYRAEVVLPTPGTYRVQVSLRLDRFDNPVASLSFPVKAGGR